jgi:hypothetical protein
MTETRDTVRLLLEENAELEREVESLAAQLAKMRAEKAGRLLDAAPQSLSMFTYVRTDRGIAVELSAVGGGLKLVHLAGDPQECLPLGGRDGLEKRDGLLGSRDDLPLREDSVADRTLLERTDKKALDLVVQAYRHLSSFVLGTRLILRTLLGTAYPRKINPDAAHSAAAREKKGG